LQGPHFRADGGSLSIQPAIANNHPFIAWTAARACPSKSSNMEKNVMGNTPAMISMHPSHSQSKGYVRVKEFIFNPGQPLPLVFEAIEAQLDPVEWLKSNKALVGEKLLQYGAVLLRGFFAPSVNIFERCAEVLCSDLFTEYGDLPREKAASRVYESTPYPPDRSILFHHEGSHTHQWPMKQWFYCAQPAQQGGCTPLADGRKIYHALDPAMREQFRSKGLRYVRNFIEGLDVSWQDFFKTNDRRVVEHSCKQAGIDCKWNGTTLRTFRACPAFAKHPRTGQMVFFNQILLHHVACLPEAVRASLLTLFPEADLPRSVYFGDGSKIPDDAIRKIQELYEQTAARFEWQPHDMVVVDNMLVAHARDPYVPPRKILVAMGEMVEFTELAAA
jgi:alpha-ketoglutarate-dependent taurine dioxygenase